MLKTSKLHKHICEFCILLLLVVSLLSRDMASPYERVIGCDGFGYYSYLPALFIYHDLSFSFVNEVYPKYYEVLKNTPLATTHIINEFDGHRVNKYYPGVSILLCPFFLIALLSAKLAGFATDGYSKIFQFTIVLAALFYVWLGLIFLKKLLNRHNYTPWLVSLTLILILFGSNLYSCSITSYSPSYAHCYLFFLVSLFCYQASLLFDKNNDPKEKYIFWLLLTLSLIIVTRPQDGLIILTLPLFGLTFQKMKEVIKRTFNSVSGLSGIFTGLILLASVLVLWHKQTGCFFVNSYHGEYFDLLRPHITDFLLGFRSGWLTYTPLMLFALSGIFLLKGRATFILLIFWTVVIFVLSSWWWWIYPGPALGQRVMVEYYPIAALTLIAFLDFLHKKKYGALALAIPFLVIPLNILQTLQFKTGIISTQYASSQSYFRNFFKTRPVPQYPIPKSIIESMIEIPIQDFSILTQSNRFSAGKKVPLPDFIKTDDYSHIRASMRIRSNSPKIKDVVVFDFSHKGKSISWNGFGLSPYIYDKDWSYYECGMLLPSTVAPGDSIAFYVWKPEGNDSTFVENLKLEFIRINDSYDFRIGHP